MRTEQALKLIKISRTAIWAVMAGAIVALPIATIRDRFRLAGWTTALILAELSCLL